MKTILELLLMSSVAYRNTWLQNKKVLHLSVLQIIYLVIIPSVLFLFFYNYIQSLLAVPRISKAFLPDMWLVDGVMLGALLSYGGLTIHAVTKMLSETSLRFSNSEAAELNKYFHLKFSHNLAFSSGILATACLTILELNHAPGQGYAGFGSAIIRGLILGGLIMMAGYLYSHSKDQYVGRWADLKAMFFTIWLALAFVGYAIWRIHPVFNNYELLVPVVVGFSIVAFLNIVLVIRRLKNGKWYLSLDWRRLSE